jgi:hypothetical protein
LRAKPSGKLLQNANICIESLLGIQVTTLSNYSIDKRRKKSEKVACSLKKQQDVPDISLETLNFML